MVLICKAYKAFYISNEKREIQNIKIRYFNFSQCFNILPVKEVSQLKISIVSYNDVLFLSLHKCNSFTPVHKINYNQN